MLGIRRFPGGSEDTASACNAGDPGSIPGLRRSPGEGNGNPLQYSCLENPTDKEPGGLQSTGSQRVGHDWATSLHFMLGIICYHHLEILSSFIHPFIWLHQVLVVACGIFIKLCESFCCGSGFLVVPHALNSCSAQAPEHTGFRSCSMKVQLLLGMWDPRPTRDQTCIPCIARQTLNHWTTRKSFEILNNF